MRLLSCLVLLLPSPSLARVVLPRVSPSVSVPRLAAANAGPALNASLAVTAASLEAPASVPSLQAAVPLQASVAASAAADASRSALAALPAARPLAALFPAAAEAPKAQARATDEAPATPAPSADEEDEAAVERAVAEERTGARKPRLERLFDGAAEMRRPLDEAWVVGEARYGSTRELARDAGSLAHGAPAVYRYSHVPPVPVSRKAHAGVMALTGATVTGALGAAFLAFDDGPYGTLGRLLAGSPDAMLTVLIGAAVLTGLGAVIGASMSVETTGERKADNDGRDAIAGRIELREGNAGPVPFFIATRGRETVTVDLLQHSFAEPLDEPELPEPWSPLVSGLAGAAAGVALGLAQWIPLAQILILPVAGPAVGSLLARSLAGDSRLPWGVLGGTLGLAFPALAVASFISAGDIGILAALEWYLSAMAVIGAVLGALAANAYRFREALEAARNPPSQWWAERPGQEEA